VLEKSGDEFGPRWAVSALGPVLVAATNAAVLPVDRAHGVPKQRFVPSFAADAGDRLGFQARTLAINDAQASAVAGASVFKITRAT